MKTPPSEVLTRAAFPPLPRIVTATTGGKGKNAGRLKMTGDIMEGVEQLQKLPRLKIVQE